MFYLFLLRNFLVTLPGHKICPDAKAKKQPCTTFTCYLWGNAQLWLEHKNLFVYTKNDNAQLSTDDNAAFVGAEQRKGKVSQVAVTTDIKYRRYWWMVQQSRDFDEWFRWMWGCNWFWFCKEIFLKLSVQNDNSNSTESHGVGGSVALREYIETKVSLRDKRQKLRFIWSKTSP